LGIGREGKGTIGSDWRGERYKREGKGQDGEGEEREEGGKVGRNFPNIKIIF